LPVLSASTITSAPLRAGTPNGPAAAPDRKVTMPILIGFSGAALSCPETGVNAHTSPAASRTRSTTV
jgi:hypothetical protein